MFTVNYVGTRRYLKSFKFFFELFSALTLKVGKVSEKNLKGIIMRSAKASPESFP